MSCSDRHRVTCDQKQTSARRGIGTTVQLVAVSATALLVLPAVRAAAQSDFRPFVGVDLLEVYDEGSDYDGGEALDVNEDGMTVGWLEDGTSGDIVPFFFDPEGYDPASGSLTILDTTDGATAYEYVVATAVSEVDGTSGDIVIVGYGKLTAASSDSFPCMWTISSGTPGSIDFFNGTTYAGRAIEVNIDAGSSGKVVGTVEHPSYSHQTGFVYDIYGDSTTYPQVSYPGEVTAVNASAQIVGWIDEGSEDSAYYAYWSGSSWSISDIHDTGTYDERAYGFRASDTIVGWYDDGASTQKAAIWIDSGSGWVQTVIAPTGSTPTSAWDINNSDEVVLSYNDASNTSGAWLWKATTTGGKSNLNSLSTLTLFPPIPPAFSASYDDDPVMHRAYAINDDLWIAGSYKPDSAESSLRPVLLIPYDTDNDGTPDIREILAGTETDSTSVGREWLIDDSEAMRPGIFAPGWDLSATQADDIDNVNAIRLVVDQDWNTALGGCATSAATFDDWGGTLAKEIVITHRNSDPDEEGYDSIPTSGYWWPRLSDVGEFSFLFCRCIDYVQIGNEIFGGPGEYYFTNYGCPGSTYTGTVTDLPASCVTQAWGDMEEWFEAKIRAIETGSALSGRPLRILSPASTREKTLVAYQGGPGGGRGDADGSMSVAANRAAYSLRVLMNLTNRHQLIFEQHIYYESYSQLSDVVTGVFDGDTEWSDPDSWCTTEVGPYPSSNWWETVMPYWPESKVCRQNRLIESSRSSADLAHTNGVGSWLLPSM